MLMRLHSLFEFDSFSTSLNIVVSSMLFAIKTECADKNCTLEVDKSMLECKKFFYSHKNTTDSE